MSKLLLAAVCLLLIQAASQTQEPAPDQIAVKITAARDAFFAERDKAEQALIGLLEKKEATAKQAGDIKTIEAVRAELDVFRKEGKLPKSVPLTSYEAAMKIARTRLENVYTASIKAYAIADNIEAAKQVQINLDELRKSVSKKDDSPEPQKMNPTGSDKKMNSPKDPFITNSVWTRSGFRLVVQERNGENFKAEYKSEKHERLIVGKVKDGLVVWYAKDSKVLRGANDSDHVGKMYKDDKGWKIDFTYYDNGEKRGSFTQRLAD